LLKSRMITRENGHSARHRAGVVKNRGMGCASPKGLSCFISPSPNYLFGSTFNVRHLYIIFALQFLSTHHNFAHFIQLIRLTARFPKSPQTISEAPSGNHRVIVIFYYVLFCIFSAICCHLLYFIAVKNALNRYIFIVFSLFFRHLLNILLNFASFRKYS
jgi:hypothetical protein